MKMRFGAGRENITVLGVCSAAGVTTSNTSTSISLPATTDDLQAIIGPYPFAAPNGLKWVPKWELAPIITPQPSPISTSTDQSSFQRLFLDRVKPLTPKDGKKRKQLDLKAKVIIFSFIFKMRDLFYIWLR